ncbi:MULTISPECIES: deaminase domain-containing protein [unclassified Pseudomonas]|uniref:deaminase domain-containing protein n=1 Tax=unclassified Pseudomonas TaxID=196821 RepID=UPI0035C175D4
MPPLDLLIDAIRRQDIVLESDVSGPYDLRTSLSLHFDRAFDIDDRFPQQLQDHQLREALEQALNGEKAARYLNAFFKRPSDTAATPHDCALFFRTLVARATPQALPFPPPAASGYRACSLAQKLWAGHHSLKHRDAFLMATLLLYSELPDQAAPALGPATPLQLAGYLDLDALLNALLAIPAGSNRTEHLFATLEAQLYFHGVRYRAPTPRECEAGYQPNEHGKVALPGTALNAPAAQVLDAVLQSQSFNQWAERLANAARLAAQVNHRDLAEQAMVDWLYPPHRRRAGVVLDFELFSEENRELPFADIRRDLVNSLQSSLDCRPAAAELAAELLLRRFAPELLLDDVPRDLPYQPDLNWANLRQGVMLLRATQRPLEYEQADQACGLPLSDISSASEALYDTLSQWGPLLGHIDSLPPWSAKQWQGIYDRYLNAWDQEQLQQRPDRMAEAYRLLEAANIDPGARNVDGQLHLEAYIDTPSTYAQKGLANVTQWFDNAFEQWLESAAKIHEQMLQRLLSQLPANYLEALNKGPWTCQAATWPRYELAGPVPAYADSPEAHWRWEVGVAGMRIVLPGEQHTTLLELFPQTLQWRESDIPANAPKHIILGPEPCYEDYNGAPPAWEVARIAVRLVEIGRSPTQHLLQALKHTYVQSVALANAATLRALCKGATRHEAFLAEKRSASNWRYAWNLIKNIVPGASCIAPENAEDAAACILDVLLGAAKTTAALRRAASPLARLYGSNAHTAGNARLGLVKAAKRWSELPALPQAVYARQLGPRRWHSLPELPGQTSWPQTFKIDQPPPRGLTPEQFRGDPARSGRPWLTWEGHPSPIAIARNDGSIDALINGGAYRYHPDEPGYLLRRIDTEALPSAPAPTLQSAPYRNEAGRYIALNFAPPANDARTPVFGQQVSHAFQTQRIEPAPIRLQDSLHPGDRWAQVMVYQGKVVRHTGQPNKPLLALKAQGAQVQLGVIIPPVYHRTITADPLAEFWFGLPDSLSPAQVQLIARVCPPVHLGGLARTVPDRRTLRAAMIDWRGRDWIIVEADTGVFYATQWDLSNWQVRQLKALSAGTLRPGNAPAPLAGNRLVLSRVREDSMIARYLEVSETYRIVATRPNLQRDIDNLTSLLHDWLEHGRPAAPRGPDLFKELHDAAEARMLPEYARNILTNPSAQDALTGVDRMSLAGLNRQIIPTSRPLRQAATGEQAHVAEVLNRLLPASGSASPYTSMSAAQLLSEPGAQQLRKHLSGANLAFATVTLDDDSRRVYFALSGGARHRTMVIDTPPETPQSRTSYIDARQRMEGQAPSSRFSELPTLRRPEHLNITEHRRHLDSERLIATVLNADLLSEHERVRSIEIFTLFSACRSCGGYVLPRLRLDYGTSSFSVSWLLDYKE